MTHARENEQKRKDVGRFIEDYRKLQKASTLSRKQTHKHCEKTPTAYVESIGYSACSSV